MPLNRYSHRTRRCLQLEALEGRALLTAGALDTSFGGTGQVITDLAYNFVPKGLNRAVRPEDGGRWDRVAEQLDRPKLREPGTCPLQFERESRLGVR